MAVIKNEKGKITPSQTEEMAMLELAKRIRQADSPDAITGGNYTEKPNNIPELPPIPKEMPPIPEKVKKTYETEGAFIIEDKVIPKIGLSEEQLKKAQKIVRYNINYVLGVGGGSGGGGTSKVTTAQGNVIEQKAGDYAPVIKPNETPTPIPTVLPEQKTLFGSVAKKVIGSIAGAETPVTNAEQLAQAGSKAADYVNYLNPVSAVANKAGAAGAKFGQKVVGDIRNELGVGTPEAVSTVPQTTTPTTPTTPPVATEVTSTTPTVATEVPTQIKSQESGVGQTNLPIGSWQQKAQKKSGEITGTYQKNAEILREQQQEVLDQSAKIADENAEITRWNAEQKLKIEEQSASEMFKIRKNAEIEYEKTRKKLESLAEEAKKPINPNRFWNSQSTEDQIIILAGIMASSVGAAIGGRDPTQAMAWADKLIQRDIDAQKYARDQSRLAMTDVTNIYEMSRQYFKDENMAIEAATAGAYKRLSYIFDREASKTNNLTEKLKLKQLAIDFDTKGNETGYNIAQKDLNIKTQLAQSQENAIFKRAQLQIQASEAAAKHRANMLQQWVPGYGLGNYILSEKDKTKLINTRIHTLSIVKSANAITKIQNEWSLLDSSGQTKPSARLRAEYGSIFMGVKNLNELGSVAAGEKELVTNLIGSNPDTWLQNIWKLNQEQIQQLSNILYRNLQTTGTSYDRPLDEDKFYRDLQEE